ncbi:interferon-induced protein with tetratricopeptide repeats 1B-like [Scomber scombrus]|uniref:interferon-induced protein with tetratricopeptide repeats 1B-like n=1 Tax=Scomber scombrus TaxID=13677 RepID=UPI002DD87F21|nr:interferon-induced protein with tetratricopeptide repeats 1B-like [Scomber scombrus]
MSLIQSTLEAKLKALQCHFTWDIDTRRAELFRLRDKLEDIGTEEGNSWLGHIYNLQGYIHCKLGLTDDARCFLNKATEAFRQSRNPVLDEGPWLVVNYGNLAWLHHQLGEQAESQTYLSKVDTLLKECPSPSQDELHPEIYAEKAWTLMKFGKDKKVLVIDYFQRAIRMQPDIVEWNTSYVIALVNPYKYSAESVEGDITGKMGMAKEHDAKNLYLAVLELEQRARKGERIEDEARELARKVLENPVSSYSGMKKLLWIYSKHISLDRAIDLAEKALEKHPHVRYLKWCAALCYEWRILSQNPVEQSKMDRAVSLHKEVISLYPDGSLLNKIALANIYAKSNHDLPQAEKTYQELLTTELEPAGKQLLYHSYEKYLKFNRKDNNKAIEYHMKAAAIPQQSHLRDKSIEALKKFLERNPRKPLCREIEELLANLAV